MKKLLQFWMTVVLTAFIGLANASTTNWYGYALYTSNSANWQNHFVSFNTQDLNEVQTVSGQLPAVWAATYWDGYVWFVTQTRSLCKAPYLSITFEPDQGYVFAQDVMVYCNGDPSIIDASESYFVENGAFMAFTKGYYVIDPSRIAEQTLENVALWPNPVVNVLYIDCMDGAVVSVFDMSGRMVMHGHYEGKLDVSQLVPGLYTILFGDCKMRFVKE